MSKSTFLLPSQKSHLLISTLSHKGFIRENNEDRLAVNAFISNEEQPKSVLLAVLADGVGGHQAGEIASQVSVESISKFIADCENLDHPEVLLTNAFLTANQAVVDYSQSNKAWLGMGSTCVSALVIEKKLFVANLGDSRLYLIRDGDIHQLTYDHTWLEELVNLKYPGVENFDRNHPLAHVLKRYLGSIEPVEVDLRIRFNDQSLNTESGLELMEDDILLLSSDGLSDLLTDQQIRDILCETKFEKAAQKLVFCSLDHGGHDNVTVILAQMPKSPTLHNL